MDMNSQRMKRLRCTTDDIPGLHNRREWFVAQLHDHRQTRLQWEQWHISTDYCIHTVNSSTNWMTFLFPSVLVSNADYVFLLLHYSCKLYSIWSRFLPFSWVGCSQLQSSQLSQEEDCEKHHVAHFSGVAVLCPVKSQLPSLPSLICCSLVLVSISEFLLYTKLVCPAGVNHSQVESL